MTPSPEQPTTSFARGSVGEVFRVFWGLGLTSFGGPVAHLGYFRDAFVTRRGWLSDVAYADLVALAQFLPGPASSQVGMAIGLKRAGYAGMAAAWCAFTLPSAILMMAFAYGFDAFGQADGSWITGIKVAALAVVAQALSGMAKSLAPDKARAAIAVVALAATIAVPTAWGQIVAIIIGGIAGMLWLKPPAPDALGAHEPLASSVSSRAAALALAIFFALLAILPITAQITGDAQLRLIDGFYRAGSLVFGGGHVVLPLLEAELVQTGMVERTAFLAGYGAAQAVPGPLFTFAAYLGTLNTAGVGGLAGGALALVSVFFPSALLVIGGVRYWDRLRQNALARHALMGVNAAVVGLLASAFYDPVFTQGAQTPEAFALAVASFVALVLWTIPPWAVVATAGLCGALIL